MAAHNLRIEASHGEKASLYIGFCSCGWVSGDGRSAEDVRAEHEEHAAGKVPPWQMKPGEMPGWDQ